MVRAQGASEVRRLVELVVGQTDRRPWDSRLMEQERSLASSPAAFLPPELLNSIFARHSDVRFKLAVGAVNRHWRSTLCLESLHWVVDPAAQCAFHRSDLDDCGCLQVSLLMLLERHRHSLRELTIFDELNLLTTGIRINVPQVTTMRVHSMSPDAQLEITSGGNLRSLVLLGCEVNMSGDSDLSGTEVTLADSWADIHTSSMIGVLVYSGSSWLPIHLVPSLETKKSQILVLRAVPDSLEYDGDQVGVEDLEDVVRHEEVCDFFSGFTSLRELEINLDFLITMFRTSSAAAGSVQMPALQRIKLYLTEGERHPSQFGAAFLGRFYNAIDPAIEELAKLSVPIHVDGTFFWRQE